MPCVNLALPAPQIPPIFLPLPAFNFTLSFGSVGVTCCKFKLPMFSPALPIPPALGAIVAEAVNAINAAIVAALATLDLAIPNCPKNGATL